MPAHLRNKFSGQQASLSATGTQGNLWPLGTFTQDQVLIESQRAHPGMPRNVVIPGFEELPNGITAHLMPLVRRWGGFNSNTILQISSTEMLWWHTGYEA